MTKPKAPKECEVVKAGRNLISRHELSIYPNARACRVEGCRLLGRHFKQYAGMIKVKPDHLDLRAPDCPGEAVINLDSC